MRAMIKKQDAQRSELSSSHVEQRMVTEKCCFSHSETVEWSTGFMPRELAGAQGKQIHKTA